MSRQQRLAAIARAIPIDAYEVWFVSSDPNTPDEQINFHQVERAGWALTRRGAYEVAARFRKTGRFQVCDTSDNVLFELVTEPSAATVARN